VYLNRRHTYENNKIKIYALFWERCAAGMQERIEGIKDFENNIKCNPIELLK
jgi:hypothetical protein